MDRQLCYLYVFFPAASHPSAPFVKNIYHPTMSLFISPFLAYSELHETLYKYRFVTYLSPFSLEPQAFYLGHLEPVPVPMVSYVPAPNFAPRLARGSPVGQHHVTILQQACSQFGISAPVYPQLCQVYRVDTLAPKTSSGCVPGDVSRLRLMGVYWHIRVLSP